MYNKNFGGPKKYSEFQDRVLDLRRVTRVTKGGKRMSFRVTVVIGDQRGKIGVGIGKGLDVASAIDKGKRQAVKNSVRIILKDNRTVAHEIESKYKAALVRIKPAAKGHGLIAGGSCRTVLELAGVKDASAKQMGRTTNKLANAMATIVALQKVNS